MKNCYRSVAWSKPLLNGNYGENRVTLPSYSESRKINDNDVAVVSTHNERDFVYLIQ